MNKFNRVIIAMILASSFLLVGCFATKNHEESTHEKMQDKDRQLD